MRRIITIILLLISIPVVAKSNTIHLKCWSDNKVIFDKQVQDVAFEKNYVFAYTPKYSYAIYEADCLAIIPNRLKKH